MAKKKMTFADKAMKKAEVIYCPECGEGYVNLTLVEPTLNEQSGRYKFIRKKVKVCKCNEKEVYA